MAEPFTLSMHTNGKVERNVGLVKRELAEHSLSDHKMLLNIFESWSMASKRDDFVNENLIHNHKMAMIKGIRDLITRYLKATKYIDDSEITRRKLNNNALNWNIVKICLTAGLYRKNFLDITSAIYFGLTFIIFCVFCSQYLPYFKIPARKHRLQI